MTLAKAGRTLLNKLLGRWKWQCGKCGSEVVSYADFCQHCGAKLVWSICPHCNSAIARWEGANFCTRCGRELVPSGNERMEGSKG